MIIKGIITKEKKKMEPSLSWDFLYFVVEDAGDSKVFQSEVAPLIDNECMWGEQEGLILKQASVLHNHTFYFKFFLAPQFNKGTHGSIFWFSKEVSSVSLMCGCEHSYHKLAHRKSIATSGYINQYAFDMRFHMRADYHTDLCKSDFIIANYYISCVRVSLKPTMYGVLQDVHMENMHKIVCSASVFWREDNHRMVHNNKVYLGRAQEISTETGYEPRGRTYVWRTKQVVDDTGAFPGLFVKTDEFWEDHASQHCDMTRLRIFNEPLSARFSVMKNVHPYMPDNDWFKNPLLVVPIEIHTEQGLALAIFNLGREDVKGVDVKFQWKDFKVEHRHPTKSQKPPTPRFAGRKKLSRRTQHVEETKYIFQQVYEGITIHVGYIVLNGKVFVTTIMLNAAHYKYDLRFDEESKFSQIKSV